MSQPRRDGPSSEELVRNNAPWMLRLAERLVSDRTLAEDVVQEAFIAALRGLDGFQGRSSLKTWLHRITVNAALMMLRKQNRLAEQPFDDDLAMFDSNDCRIEPRWGRLPEVEEVVQSAATRQRVRDAIARLPERYRIVLELRDIEGYDTSEVAGALAISESNVKVRLHRARAALKRLLEPVLRGETR